MPPPDPDPQDDRTTCRRRDDGRDDSGADVAAIAHDPAALEAFYRAHIEAISRFVARRVDDPHSAADLTAEVFLAALGSAHTYRGGPGSARAWLYGVARNVVANDRRRSAREAEAARRIAGRRLVDADDIGRLEERLDAEAEARNTYRALQKLSHADRTVLELVAVDGLGVHEAAHVLGTSTVTTRVRLHRARKRLAQALRCDDGPPAGSAAADARATSPTPVAPAPTRLTADTTPHVEAPA